MGVLRFVLALFVIFSHAGSNLLVPAGNDHFFQMYNFGGRNAVGLFYIISGFYMAMILTEKYSASLKSFYISRAMRLFPTYWFSLILGFILISSEFSRILGMINMLPWGTQIYYHICNFLMIGSDTSYLVTVNDSGMHLDPFGVSETHNGFSFLLNPPVFTIGIEIIFYILCPFIIKSLRHTIFFLCFGLSYHIAIKYFGVNNLMYQYHLFPSSILYFTLGILSYRLYQRGLTPIDNKTYTYFLIYAFILLLIEPLLPNLYLFIFPLFVPSLFQLTKNNRIDRFLGDLSYPLYMTHYIILKYFWSIGTDLKWLGTYVTFSSVAAAILIHWFLERPVDRYRYNFAKKLQAKRKNIRQGSD